MGGGRGGGEIEMQAKESGLTGIQVVMKENFNE